MAHIKINYNAKSEELFRAEEKLANAKSRLQSLGLFPVVRDNILEVYSVKASPDNVSIFETLEKSLGNTYEEAFYYGDSSYQGPKYKTEITLPIAKRAATPENLYDLLGLDDEKHRQKFMQENARECEVQIPYQNGIYLKDYRLEGLKEVLERLCRDYAVHIYKRESKIAELLKKISSCLDNDSIFSILYEFLNGQKVNFSEGVNNVSSIQKIAEEMPFSETELSLTETEKRIILNDLFSAFTYTNLSSKTISTLNSRYGIDKNSLLLIGKHNAAVLDTLEVQEIVSKFKKIKTYSLKR